MTKFDKKEVIKEKANHNCTAYGCPLGGSMNIGGAGWFCRFHNGKDFKDFSDITLKIKHAIPMIQRCHELQVNPFNEQLHVYMRNRDFDKLEDENAWKYRDRLLEYVKNYVMNGVELSVKAQAEAKSIHAADIATKLDIAKAF